MVERKEIVNIKIDNLCEHPDNPRKNIGDVSELAESIKKNGVMQNLTVMPLSALDESPEQQTPAEKISTISNFYVLIGHRRLKAAREAGLTEVPCRIVSELSRSEQVGIMMAENLQRNDLTIYEQAQGFQMMLDLGETVEDIVDKTGFSKTTVYHRVNLAKLDQELLQEKEADENFQITLKDLYELEKIESIDTRNEILKDAGNSSSLQWKAKMAVRYEIREKNAQKLLKTIEAMGITQHPDIREYYQISGSGKYELVMSIEVLDTDMQTDEVEIEDKYEDKELFYLKPYNTVYIFTPRESIEEDEEDLENAEDAEESAAEDAEEKRREELKEKCIQAEEEMTTFIKDIINEEIDGPDENYETVEKMWKTLVWNKSSKYMSAGYDDIIGFLADKMVYRLSKEEKSEFIEKDKELSVVKQLLAILGYNLDGEDLFRYPDKYDEDEGDYFEQVYTILEACGFSFSDPELNNIISGTSELFV
jgi:ParB family chromosome partitioning protein